MFRRSFKKKKEKKHEVEDGTHHRSTTEIQLSNYSQAVQLSQYYKEENARLRRELEYTKRALAAKSTDVQECSRFLQPCQPKSTAINQSAAPGHETATNTSPAPNRDRVEARGEADDSHHLLQSQSKNVISELKKFIEELQNNCFKKQEEESVRLQDSLKRHYDTLDATIKFNSDKRPSNITAENRKLEERIASLTKKCEFLDKSLTKEIRKHCEFEIQLIEGIQQDMHDGHCRLLDVGKNCQELTENVKTKLEELLQLNDVRRLPSHDAAKMPHHVLEFAFKIEDMIPTLPKVKEFSRALGLNPSIVDKISSEGDCTPKDLLWKMICEWCSEFGNKASLRLMVKACRQIGLRPIEDGTMSRLHQKAIERTYSRLESDLVVSCVVSYLRDIGQLTPSDVFYVLKAETRREQCACLVDILPLFGKKAFHIFHVALVKSGHQHVADELHANLEKLQQGAPGQHQSSGVETDPIEYPDDDKYTADNQGISVRHMASMFTSIKHIEAMLMDFPDLKDNETPRGTLKNREFLSTVR